MTYSVHLLVVLHGLWGKTAHVQYIKDSATKHYDEGTLPAFKDDSTSDSSDIRLVVLTPEMNAWTKSYDGVDICAERVLQELDDEITRIEEDGGKVVRFSLVGYSLGGLVARYLLGLLASRTPSLFATVKPVNFATFASPAIGVPQYNSFLSKFIHFFGARLLSRSGSQLYGNDHFLPQSFLNPTKKQGEKREKSFFGRRKTKEQHVTLLEVMADPRYAFHRALIAFKRIEIYANAVHDRTVPMPSGAIEEHDPFALALAKARLVADEQDKVELATDVRVGGLEVIMESGCSIIKSYTSIDSPYSSSTPSKRRFRIPIPAVLRPSTYPLPRPLAIFLCTCLPITLPLSFLWFLFLAGNLVVHGHKSRRRIRAQRLKTGGGRDGLLARVGFKLEQAAEAVVGVDQPVELTTTTSLDDRPLLEVLTSASLSTSSSSSGAGTPPLTRPLLPPSRPSSLTLDDNFATDPVLTPAQNRMIKNLNSIPHLRKHLVFSANPENLRAVHGAIIARDPWRKEAFALGQKVVDRWAGEFLL